ncbi:MAG: GNAT family N-acetyltransferase [Clostridia bacterium]|nr:GNAT family N-acetyltransferase [Clostridia bacterium]
MILRHAREQVNGQPIENCFEAIDERSGKKLGSCTIYVQENENLFPNRPVRIYMEIEGDPAPDALLGASVARAKELALKFRRPARIFTQVEPEDEVRLASLSALGFRDTDGLVDMQRKLPYVRGADLPNGCVTVVDDLDDPLEQDYFLERYNHLFGEDYDMEWLQTLRKHKDFKRVLIVAPNGMVGESIIWHEGKKGVIAWLHIARRWRRKGLSRVLLDLVCKEFTRCDMDFASAEIQVRIPNILKVMEKADFQQTRLIMRYPGIDWN